MSKQSLGEKNQARNEAEGLTDAENYIKEACKILQKEATRLRQEQEAFDSMSKKLDRVHFSSKINLDVGGHLFKTSVQTLTKDPNSMLAAMFSGRFEMKPSEDGSYFIDRDGTHFRFILNYLRTGKLTLPEGTTFLKELEEEAEFYQIQGIIDELKSSKPSTIQASKPTKSFEESEILTNDEHRDMLKSWLPPGGKWVLLFRASRDGFAAATFHSRCDNKGATVTIVKSGNNIFGGFTEESWTSQGGWRTGRDAFLFSMVNPHGLGPTKMPLKSEQQQCAIYCRSSYGPLLGGGNDLRISDNANTNNSSYSKLGVSYECPPGQQSTFFTGGQNFTVTNYEVFAL
ncbi:uncharacterized protein LOC144635234 isoform X1 [Oculina patagonica]